MWHSGVTLSAVPTVCATGDAPGLWIVLTLAVLGAASLVVGAAQWLDNLRLKMRRAAGIPDRIPTRKETRHD